MSRGPEQPKTEEKLPEGPKAEEKLSKDTKPAESPKDEEKAVEAPKEGASYERLEYVRKRLAEAAANRKEAEDNIKEYEGKSKKEKRRMGEFQREWIEYDYDQRNVWAEMESRYKEEERIITLRLEVENYIET